MNTLPLRALVSVATGRLVERRRAVGLLRIVLAGLLLPAALQADWPNWRGPSHDGVSLETDLQLVFSASPSLLWEVELGSAFSGISAVGRRLYTCGTKDRRQVLFALDADSGRIVWERPIEPELEERQGGDGTRATPSVSDGSVYVLGGHGTLLSADAKTGRVVWQKKYGHKPQWAYSGSVLIEGGLAILSPGEGDGGLLALDKRDGRTVWKAGDGAAGYSTPYPFTFQGRRLVAGLLARELIVVDVKTGRLLWRTPWKTSFDVNAATPIHHQGHLFVSSGYGTGCALYRLEARGAELGATEVWRNKAIRSKFQTCILHEGKLYGADEQALKCADFMTGDLLWTEPRLDRGRTQHGSVVLAGGHLLFLSEEGTLYSAKASPEGFHPAGSVRLLSGRCWTVPTLHAGRLYARNLKKLVCLDLRGGSVR